MPNSLPGLNLRQFPLFQDRVYLVYKLRFDQVLFRIRKPEIPEDILTADLKRLFAHLPSVSRSLVLLAAAF